MNNGTYRQPEMEINIKEVLWDLLEQWKAILIASILIALLVAGAKYSKDFNAYKAALQEKKEANQSKLSVEERIADVLVPFSEDEAATIEVMVKQNEWIEMQKEYINKSILMNTNPTNQRSLILEYYISMDGTEDSKINALLSGYIGYLKSEKLLDQVGRAIDPKAERKYITELIVLKDTEVVDLDLNGAVMEFRVVLPDGADSEKVERAFTAVLTEYTPDLNNKIGGHRIGLLKASEAYVYGEGSLEKKNDILNSINTLQNNAKNMQASLSEEQKVAIEKITAIKKEASEKNSQNNADNKAIGDQKQKTVDQLSKPGFSKKYTVLGFVLGIILYAFIYLMRLITRGRVNYASDVEAYTKDRLLGSVNSMERNKPFSWLFHSKFIREKRYGKEDVNEQLNRIAESATSLCKHNKTKNLTVICLSDEKEGIDESIKEALLKKIEAEEIRAELLNLNNTIKENSLLNTANTIVAIKKDTRISLLTELKELLHTYDIKNIGCAFIR